MSFPSGSSTLVPTALAALRAAHPGTRVSLVEAEPPRLGRDAARAGDCDVALAFRYEGAGGRRASGTTWWSARCSPTGWSACVPEGHRLAAARRPVAIGELAGEPWIAGCPRCRGQLVEVCESGGLHAAIDFATDDYPAVVGLVAARVWAWRCCRSWPGVRTAEGVRARGAASRPSGGEIVALTLPDLAQVPAVAATLDQLGGPRRAQSPRPLSEAGAAGPSD